jgi:hypothetical protein
MSDMYKPKKKNVCIKELKGSITEEKEGLNYPLAKRPGTFSLFPT